MRKIVLAIVLACFFSQTAFAGEWKTDEKGTRYVQDDGTYVNGWYQDIDGKWYYFDGRTGYMLKNSQTPDGYTVDSSGAWIEEKVMTTNALDYDNCEELNVSAIKEPLGYTIPVKVFYNNTYKNHPEGTINVLGTELSKDGAPYLKLSGTDIPLYGEVYQVCKFILSDGTILEWNGKRGDYFEAGSPSNIYKWSLLLDVQIIDIFRNNKVDSVEVRIDESRPDE